MALMQMELFGEYYGASVAESFKTDNSDADALPKGGDADEYLQFLKKFESKKTTDDCYTPPAVYDTLADYVSGRWGIPRKNFVRPFFPGGDFENFNYHAGSVVVDNPPFSILSKIIRFYRKHGVRFFLFAPTLTLFNYGFDGITHIITNSKVVYDNGALVNTSFVTNLPCENAIEVLPGLKCEIEQAQKIERKRMLKLNFPKFVINSARLGKYASKGIEMKFRRDDVLFTKHFGGVSIFGGGAMLSPQGAAAMERANAAAMEMANAAAMESENEIKPVEEDFEMMRKIGW